MRPISRILREQHTPKTTKLPFGLKPSTAPTPKIVLNRTNLESSGLGVLEVSSQHLAALSTMHAKISGLKSLRASVMQINQEGRSPTDIEEKLLIQEARSVMDLESMSFDDLVRPIGTWNMEAEGDDEEDDEDEENDGETTGDPDAQDATGDEGSAEDADAASAEPVEPTEEEIDESADGSDGSDVLDESGSAATEDESGEPTEPVDETGTGDANSAEGTEGLGDDAVAPSASEADVLAAQQEAQGEPLPPEHKVNVIMRAGEVEINIEDALDRYIGVAESFHEDLKNFTAQGYAEAKEVIAKLGDKLYSQRSENSMMGVYDLTTSLDLEQAKIIFGNGDKGQNIHVALNGLVSTLLGDFYLRTVPEALAQYEAGNYANGADMLIAGIRSMGDYNKLGFLVNVGLIPGSESEVIVTNKSISNGAADSTDIAITIHELTIINNAAINLCDQIVKSTFLQDFTALEARAAKIATAPEFAGTEGDPRYYINHFSPTFHLQNVYILKAVTAYLETLVVLNSNIRKS